MKSILPIAKYYTALILLAITATADDYTLFNTSGTTVTRLERVRSIPPQKAPTLADHVREYGYRGLPYATNEVTEIEFGETNTYNSISYSLDTPQKYWKWIDPDIAYMTEAERDVVDNNLTNAWVTANTKSVEQLRAEGRVVELVTNNWPSVTFPVTEQQISDLGDLVLVKVNTQRLPYGTQANATLIGEFIADNEALSDLPSILDYIEATFNAYPTDPTFGRQVQASDYTGE